MSLLSKKLGGTVPPIVCNIRWILLFRLTFLVCNCAGGLASRLAGALALAAAALYSGSLQVSLVDGCDVLQTKHLFRVVLQVTACYHY